MIKQGDKDFKKAIKLIKKVLENPSEAIEHSRIDRRYQILTQDYEKLSFEYDLLLTTYERLHSRHRRLLTSTSG